MTLYTSLNLTEANELATQFAIGNVHSLKGLSGGSENSNYLLTTEKGKYVLTICEQKTQSEADQLAQLLEHLASNHFPTSKIIRTTGNATTILWKNKPVILKAFIDGTIIQDYPEHLLVLLGRTLAQLHLIEAPTYLPKGINYGIHHFSEMEKYAPNDPFYSWLKEIKTIVEQYIDADLPQCLIHSDVFYSNVIVSEQNDAVTIMDFEEAGYYFRIFDIGMTIVGICGEGKTVNLFKTSHLLKGYQQVVELTTIERNALQTFTVYAAAAMSFWRHKNFNYTNPTPTMKDHYKALKYIADDVKQLPEGSFFE